MYSIKSIKKFSFELKIAVLFFIIWAGYQQQISQKQQQILSNKTTKTITKTGLEYPTMVVIKKM